MIKSWEKETGAKWPTLANGNRATPHHIIPLKNGGANEWWNLAPVNHPHVKNLHGKGTALNTQLSYSKNKLPAGTISEL